MKVELDRGDQVSLLLIGGLFAIALFGASQISGDLAIHFSESGQPDSKMSKMTGLLILPTISVLLFVFFRVMPSIDPLKENYESFSKSFKIFKMILIGSLLILQAFIVFWNLGFQINPLVVLTPIVFLIYYMVGVLMEDAGRNWFIGIRTPWTLESDEVWRKTHDKVAPLLKLSAVIALIAPLFPGYSTLIFLAPILGSVMFGVLYSYWVYRED